MIDDVETKVDLDTTEAKAKLRDLDKRKKQSKNRARSQVWGKLRARVGQTFGTVSGYSSVTRVARMHSGPVDPWVAALRPIEGAVQQTIDESIKHSMAGRRRARDQTVEKYSLNVGVDKTGATLASAVEYFTLANKDTAMEEAGRNILRQTLVGPDFDELIEQATKGYKKLLGKAFDYVVEEFNK